VAGPVDARSGQIWGGSSLCRPVGHGCLLDRGRELQGVRETVGVDLATAVLVHARDSSDAGGGEVVEGERKELELGSGSPPESPFRATRASTSDRMDRYGI